MTEWNNRHLFFQLGSGAQALEGAVHGFGQVHRVPLQTRAAARRPAGGTFGTTWILPVAVCDPGDPEQPVGVEVVFGRAGGHCGTGEQEAES